MYNFICHKNNIILIIGNNAQKLTITIHSTPHKSPEVYFRHTSFETVTVNVMTVMCHIAGVPSLKITRA